MIKKVRDIIDQLTRKPRAIFLIDSIGAMLTTLLLIVVLKNLNEYFGMPLPILTCLSVIAICLCIYSTTCYFFLKENWMPFIKAISIFNMLYAVLTLVLILAYYPILTNIGIAYFLIEIMIVCGLAYIEYSVAIKLKRIQIL